MDLQGSGLRARTIDSEHRKEGWSNSILLRATAFVDAKQEIASAVKRAHSDDARSNTARKSTNTCEAV